MAHFNIDLDLDKSQAVGQVVRARVGDVESCVIAATIYDHGSEVDLAGRSARFCMLKPDRTVIEDDDCEVDGSTVTHTLGSQATAAAGVAELAYFEILEGSTVIDSTQSFRLVIEPDAEGAGSGPSEDYISRVDAAVEAANDAAEAATGAAQSATAAAGAANDAAEGATQAAQTANAAAEAASAAAEAARGNVLKGELGPDPLLSADDAYATTPRRLTVYGETRQNLWVNPSGSANGVTVTSNSDGSLTFAGTSTNNTSFRTEACYTLVRGKTYTLSVDKDIQANVIISILIRRTDGTTILQQYLSSSTKSRTFTADDLADFSHVQFDVNVNTAGITVSGTYRVMLNEGSEPEPWCPPGLNSVDELSVVTSGKNLLTSAFGSVDYSNHGGVVYGQADMACPVALSGQTVAVSVRVDGEDVTSTPGWAMYIGFVGNVSTDSDLILTSNVRSGTVGDVRTGAKIRFYANSDFWPTGCIIEVQLELGTVATDYEPPTVTTTPVDLDGNSLRSLPDGTCDELVIKPDGSAYIEKKVGSTVVTGDVTWKGPYDTPFTYFTSPNAIDASATTDTHRRAYSDKLIVSNSMPNSVYIANKQYRDMYIRDPTFADTTDGVKDFFASNNMTYVFPYAEPQLIKLPPVTLPTLPAPTVNVFADAESSGTGYAMGPDMGMEYERDVTVAFDRLQAQVSALNILEATNG